MMVYSQMIIADANVVRFWSACQLSRRELVNVQLQPVVCFDTLASSLEAINDSLDLVIVSVLTGFLIEEGSGLDIRGTCSNVLSSALRPIYSAAKKSSKVEVPNKFFLGFNVYWFLF